MDSNHRYRIKKQPVLAARVRSRNSPSAQKPALSCRDRWFESISLQRRVCEPSVPLENLLGFGQRRRAGPTDPIGRPAGQLRRDEGWPNQRAHPPPLPGSVLIWPEPRCDPGAENDGGYNIGRENTPFRNEDHERWLRFERRIIRADYVGAHPEHKPQHRQAYSKPQKSPAQIYLVVRRSATIAALTAACGLSTGG